jgi:hypothetical protein
MIANQMAAIKRGKRSKPFRRASISIPVRGYVGNVPRGQLTELFKDAFKRSLI